MVSSGSSAEANIENIYGIAVKSNDIDGSFSNDGNVAITATGSVSGSSSSASLSIDGIYGIYADNSLTGSFSNSGNITIVASADADASSSGYLYIDDVYGLD